MERSERLKIKFFKAGDKDISKELEKFPLIIREVVQEIWERSCIGLSSDLIQIGYYYYTEYKFPDVGTVGSYEDTHCNHYLLGIPYAGRIIKWDLILRSSTGYIPDFVFDDDFQENPDTNVISAHVPSIVNWTVDQHSLVDVLKELMKLYKEFNVKKLEHDDLFNVKLEYEELFVHDKNYSPENVEVLVRGDYAYILVPLDFNFSCLIPYAQKEDPETLGLFEHPHQDTATLQFSYNIMSLKSETALILSPRLEQLLLSSKTVKIPTYTNKGGIVDYIGRMETLLQERSNVVIHNYEKRKEFVTAILNEFGFAVIEYDEALFNMITLLFDINKNYVTVLIKISDEFPNEQPEVNLLSVYAISQSKPQKIVSDNYPYSPRWKPQELFARIMKYVENEMSKGKLTNV